MKQFIGWLLLVIFIFGVCFIISNFSIVVAIVGVIISGLLFGFAWLISWLLLP